MLEVLRDEKQLGVLIFYAVHPTAMTHDSELYSSDLAGVAMRLLEEQGTPVAAFFNGAEGDVSPDWTLQDRDDVLRLGTRLSNSVRQLLGGGQAWPIDNPNIDVQWKGVNIDWFAPGGHPRFASAPVSGAAELGGAEDGRTIFFNYGWRGDARKTMPEGDQGTKEPALEEPLKAAFTDLDMKDVGSIVNALKPMTLFAPPSHFPQEFPIAKVRIGDSFMIAAIPVEATTAVGVQIRDRLESSASRDKLKTVIIGLANEYLGYTVSEKEYDLQQYEGASTLLGPEEAATIVELLADTSSGPPAARVQKETFDAGPERKSRFGPHSHPVSAPRNMLDEGLEPLMPRSLKRMESRVPRFEWTESDDEEWASDKRSVEIYSVDNQGHIERVDTDLDFNVLTVLVDGSSSNLRYAAMWIPTDRTTSREWFFFAVRTPGGTQFCSKRFRLDELDAIAPVPYVYPVSGSCLVGNTTVR